jgi:uncharacterized membrane protein YsdA (DUF1294 family)
MVEKILVAVLVVNVITFLAFGWDKWMARRGSWRTPEARLLLLAFATGLAGAWTGMRVFRHKTRKTSFRRRMIAVTILNPAWLLLYLWLS